jgi:adenosylcobinamide kinase/adenosylcobinamide-phosphate guanylyltransferase
VIHLILGGARSGKSQFAENLVLASNKQAFYLATSQALDAEMVLRIREHQQRRDVRWLSIEEPIFLADCVLQHDSVHNVILVDCLTLWLSNCLFHGDSTMWQEQRSALLVALQNIQADVYLVSNEVGRGVIPMGAETRAFVDEAGLLHQSLAAIADKVTFVTAGLPQILKV